MKQLLVLAGCAILLLVLASCARQNQRASNLPPSAGQENEFPDFLADSVWKADTYNWAFKFKRDGTISRMIHVLPGPVKMEEGGIYVEGPDPGTFAYFVIWPSRAKYNPINRQLSVKIVLDEFLMRLPQGDIEGRSEDYFDGPVSEDGKTWTVSWRNYSSLKGGSPPDPNFVEQNPEKLVFTKMDINDVEFTRKDVNDINNVNDINGVK